MGYGLLIDAREWSVLVDLATGRRIDPPMAGSHAELMRSIQHIVGSNPYPGDFEPESIDWVTNVALQLNRTYQPHFMLLSYAQPHFLACFRDLPRDAWHNMVDHLFRSVDRFVSSSGFTPIVVGLGSMVPLRGYVDLSGIDGLVQSSGGTTYHAGLFEPSTQDLSRIEKMPGIERIVSKQEFVRTFGGAPDFVRRFPDYLVESKEGYALKACGSMARPVYRIPAKCQRIPVSIPFGTESADSLTDIKTLILQQIRSTKVALIVLEAIGDADFGLDHTMCSNTASWFTYSQDQNQYLAITTLKIGPVAAGRRRMNEALHSRVLKDSMVTLYSSASSFLIARRATASWFNLSKWSATLKAAPSQLAAAG